MKYTALFLLFVAPLAFGQVTLLEAQNTEAAADPSDHADPAGTSRCLILASGIGTTGATMDSVTYGGQSMTKIDETAEWRNKTLYLWFLDETGVAAASTNAFSASYSGSPLATRTAHTSIFLNNCNQSTPTDYGEVTGQTANPIEVALTGGIDSFGIAVARTDGASANWSWNNSWTEQMDSTTLAGDNDHTVGYYDYPNNNAQTASATDGSGNQKGMLAVQINPPTASGSAAPPRRRRQ